MTQGAQRKLQQVGYPNAPREFEFLSLAVPATPLSLTVTGIGFALHRYSQALPYGLTPIYQNPDTNWA